MPETHPPEPYLVVAANEDHGHSHAESAHQVMDGAHQHAADVHTTVGEMTGHDAAHGADHGHSTYHYPRHIEHPPELPHFIQIWWTLEAEHKKEVGEDPYGKPGGPYTVAQVLHVGRRETKAPFVDYAPWENNVFALIAAFLLLGIFWLGTKPFRRSREDAMRKPTRVQAAMEMLVSGIDSFCKSILGEKNGPAYMPFVAGLFFFILIMNFMGMIPLMKAPTSSILITGSLAFTTFLYYMYVASFKMGLHNFLFHMAGEPRSVPQWILAPLIFLIEAIGWFVAKPLSLALRLFGNILGKDILFGVMLGLGIMISAGVSTSMAQWIGFPLTYPFYFLGLLLSAVQAVIFALLSAIYILLVLPHDDHGEEHH